MIVREFPETGFLREYFVTGEEMGKKTRFLKIVRVFRNRVFTRILRYRRRDEKKTVSLFTISCYTVDTLYIHPQKKVNYSE